MIPPYNPDDLQDAVNAMTLVDPCSRYDVDEELLIAGRFVAEFGTLRELFDPDQIQQVQGWDGPKACAWGLLAHWSIERGDLTPNSGEDFPHADACRFCAYLESVALLRDDFEHENCEECDLDLGQHGIVADPCAQENGGADAGLAVAACRNIWTRCEPVVHESFPTSDDVRETTLGGEPAKAYDARWLAHLSDGNHALVTRTYYLSDEFDQDGKPTGNDVHIVRVDEFLVCTDPADPGGTEINANYVYNPLDNSASLDTYRLALDSFEPEPGEWREEAPAGGYGDLLIAAPDLALV